MLLVILYYDVLATCFVTYIDGVQTLNHLMTAQGKKTS